MSQDDFALALQLQEEENFGAINDLDNDNEEVVELEVSRKHDHVGGIEDPENSSLSLVDPKWEIIDPVPDIRSLFILFNRKYFYGKLDGIEVKWSSRMTLCAGLCVYEGHGGLCSVRLSEPLLKLRPRKDLIETLLHEMIHAYLFVTHNNRDHDAHGPEFHKHMYRLNKETGTNITVYHNFHDEVDNYRQHWWRCDGPCRQRQPYYGYVKRSMNRAPSARDPWWPDHARTCGGTYTKVKEPEGYGQKKSKSDKAGKESKADKQNNADIRKLFGSKGKTLEHNDSNGSTKSSITQTNSNKTVPTDPKDKRGVVGAKTIWNIGSSPAKSQKQLTLFEGNGITLGGNTGSQKSDVIVRKLPGIGTITAERTANGAIARTNKPLIAKAGPEKVTEGNHGKRRSDETNSNKNEDAKRKKPNEYTDDSSDEELDAALKRLSAKKRKARKSGNASKVMTVDSKSQLTRHSPVGSTVKVKKFLSTGSKKASPSIIKMLNMNAAAGGSPVAGPSRRSDGATAKRPDPSSSWAQGRNQRVIALDSDSETDDDENAPLRAMGRDTSLSSKKDHPKNTGAMVRTPSDLHKSRITCSSSEQDSSDDDCSLLEPVKKNVVADKDEWNLVVPSTSGSHTAGKPAVERLNNRDVNDRDDKSDESLQTCPVCDQKIPSAQINEHLDNCAEIENSTLSHSQASISLIDDSDGDDDDVVVNDNDDDDVVVAGDDRISADGLAELAASILHSVPSPSRNRKDRQVIDDDSDVIVSDSEDLTPPLNQSALGQNNSASRAGYEDLISIPDEAGEEVEHMTAAVNRVNVVDVDAGEEPRVAGAGVRQVTCPICQRKVAETEINQHLDTCMAEREPTPEGPPDIDPNMSSCPVCQAQVPAASINEHLDQCLT